MPFQTEPPYTHGQAERTAVLLCNLGTPDEPTASAVRRYLSDFLGDHRVVEIPRLVWWPILHGIILRTRPAKSAEKYASVWTPEGSPLAVWTAKQATLLRGWLGQAGHNVLVRHAMRYGNPSIASQLDALKAEGATRILILPLYPQYSATTTASVLDAVYSWAARTRNVPELRFVNRYHDHPGYIDALALSIETHWKHHGQPDKLVMSFHGVPERTLHLGDPYHCECLKTARLLADRLGLSAERWRVTFEGRAHGPIGLRGDRIPQVRDEDGDEGTRRIRGGLGEYFAPGGKVGVRRRRAGLSRCQAPDRRLQRPGCQRQRPGRAVMPQDRREHHCRQPVPTAGSVDVRELPLAGAGRRGQPHGIRNGRAPALDLRREVVLDGRQALRRRPVEFTHRASLGTTTPVRLPSRTGVVVLVGRLRRRPRTAGPSEHAGARTATGAAA